MHKFEKGNKKKKEEVKILFNTLTCFRALERVADSRFFIIRLSRRSLELLSDTANLLFPLAPNNPCEDKPLDGTGFS